jgi:4-cresol dehydrogenase (hydroxylating) flavoprotein subunit
MTLGPPDVFDAAASPDAAARALDALGRELGAGAVTRSEAALREYRDPYSFAGSDTHVASGVVAPTSVEQVQTVVRVAAEHRVPLWTFSQGRNNGYGGAAPRVAGSILVNLREMNRIVEIDDDLCHAIVEPGVRFLDLYAALKQGGHALWQSIPDIGWGSIVGNTLDHGVGFIGLGDHPQRQCGMEVVLASGDVLRTGLGALPTARNWTAARRWFGPTVDSLFMQSNFGIVTKMGVWLRPQPESYMSCEVNVENEDDLDALIETLRPLMLDGTIENIPVAFNPSLSAGVFGGLNRADYYDGDGPVPREIVKRMADDAGVGWWYMRFALYGLHEVVDAKWRRCRKAFARIPGARVTGRQYDGATAQEQVAPRRAPEDGPLIQVHADRTQAGVPGLEILDNISWDEEDTAGHLDYSPVAALTGEEAVRQHKLLRTLFESRGFDYASSLMMISPRSFVNIASLWFDTTDEAACKHAYDSIRWMVREAGKEGYVPYRAHLDVMDVAAEQQSFGDHAMRRFNEAVKDAVDPAGILAPGKQGIWPAAMRPAGR